MRLLSAMLLTTTLARADLITITFSGVWDHTAGLAHAGDPFTGQARWDSALGFSSPAQYSISTFPQLKSVIVRTDMTLVSYFPPPGPSLCSPEESYEGPVAYYMLTITPTAAQLICGDAGPFTKVAYSFAPAYHYALSTTSMVVSNPEPRYGALLLVLTLLAIRARFRVVGGLYQLLFIGRARFTEGPAELRE